MRSIEWLEKPLWQKSAFQLLVRRRRAPAKAPTSPGSPHGSATTTQNVLFVSSEDSAEIDTGPRLVAAGANLERCHIIANQHVQLPDDVATLRDLALELGGVGLLVVDPVANHIGASNSNSEAEVRNAIAPLNGLADDSAASSSASVIPARTEAAAPSPASSDQHAWTDTPEPS